MPTKATSRSNGRSSPGDLASTAVEVAAAASGDVLERDRLTLDSGIVLKLSPVPPFVFDFAQEKHPIPPPPVVMVEDKGREEPNPNDPDYIALVEKIRAEQMMIISDAAFVLGVEIDYVPIELEGPDGDNWIQACEVVGIEIDRENAKKRKLQWLRYYALRTPLDIATVTRYCMGKTGTPEEVVQQVIESFRRQSRR